MRIDSAISSVTRRLSAVRARLAPSVTGPVADGSTAVDPGPSTDAGTRPATAAEVLRSAMRGPTAEQRVAMTLSCRDSDSIAKVDGAGTTAMRDGVAVQIMHNGLVVEHGGYYGDWMAEVISGLRGHHEPQEELVFHTIMERLASTAGAPVMIELGCFWAYYSLWFLHRFPDGVALAAEPDPDHLDVGRRNAALNDLAPIFVQCAAGASADDVLDLESELHPGLRHTVPIRTVPELADAHGLGTIDILHLDIQGAELSTLEAARGLFDAGRVRFVVVSTHHHIISGDPILHERTLEWLLDRGAHIICEHSIPESFSGDGLIAASFAEQDRDLTVEVSHNRAGDALFQATEFDLAAMIEAYERLRTDRSS